MRMQMTGEPMVLREVRITNLRCFEHFDLKLTSRPRKRGQWTVVVGENGVGKSTLLRAITLATLGSSQAESLEHLMMGSPMLRYRCDSGQAVVDSQYHGRGEYEALDRSFETKQSDSWSEAMPIAVYAYGCSRGSAVGGADRGVGFGSLEGVRTLFSEKSNLVHAETWLRDVELRALKSSGGRSEAFRDAVHSTLVGLLPGVDRIELDEENNVLLHGDAIGRTTIGALSDGYATTLGWVLDLVARWSESWRKNEGSLDGEFAGQMTGLVLVDELDLHLHPSWQIQVVKDLRKALPRMSFITTTHNPLTLRGAKKGEVFVLRRSRDGQIEYRQIDLEPGLGTDEILVGDWFGLGTTLDQDTTELLERYQKMLIGKAPGDELVKLEREIRRRIGSFAPTRTQKAAQQVIAEIEDDEVLQEKDFASLRDKVRARLEEKL